MGGIEKKVAQHDIINYLSEHAPNLGIATVFKLLGKIDFPVDNIIFVSDSLFSSQQTLINSIDFCEDKVMVKVNMGLLSLQSPLLDILLIDETLAYERELQFAINRYITMAIKLLYIDLIEEFRYVYQNTCFHYDVPEFSFSVFNTLTSYALAKYKCKVDIEDNNELKALPSFLGKSKLVGNQGINRDENRFNKLIIINLYTSSILDNEAIIDVIKTVKEKLIAKYDDVFHQLNCQLLIINHYECHSDERHILPSVLNIDNKIIKGSQLIYREDFYDKN